MLSLQVVRLEGIHARFPQSLSREMLYGMIRNRVVHEEKAVQKLVVPAHVLTHGAKVSNNNKPNLTTH